MPADRDVETRIRALEERLDAVESEVRWLTMHLEDRARRDAAIRREFQRIRDSVRRGEEPDRHRRDPPAAH